MLSKTNLIQVAKSLKVTVNLKELKELGICFGGCVGVNLFFQPNFGSAFAYALAAAFPYLIAVSGVFIYKLIKKREIHIYSSYAFIIVMLLLTGFQIYNTIQNPPEEDPNTKMLRETNESMKSIDAWKP